MYFQEYELNKRFSRTLQKKEGFKRDMVLFEKDLVEDMESDIRTTDIQEETSGQLLEIKTSVRECLENKSDYSYKYLLHQLHDNALRLTIVYKARFGNKNDFWTIVRLLTNLLCALYKDHIILGLPPSLYPCDTLLKTLTEIDKLLIICCDNGNTMRELKITRDFDCVIRTVKSAFNQKYFCRGVGLYESLSGLFVSIYRIKFWFLTVARLVVLPHFRPGKLFKYKYIMT